MFSAYAFRPRADSIYVAWSILTCAQGTNIRPSYRFCFCHRHYTCHLYLHAFHSSATQYTLIIISMVIKHLIYHWHSTFPISCIPRRLPSSFRIVPNALTSTLPRTKRLTQSQTIQNPPLLALTRRPTLVSSLPSTWMTRLVLAYTRTLYVYTPDPNSTRTSTLGLGFLQVKFRTQFHTMVATHHALLILSRYCCY